MEQETADESETQLDSLDLSLKCGDFVVSLTLMTQPPPFYI
jgi:hypothetical protein